MFSRIYSSGLLALSCFEASVLQQSRQISVMVLIYQHLLLISISYLFVSDLGLFVYLLLMLAFYLPVSLFVSILSFADSVISKQLKSLNSNKVQKTSQTANPNPQVVLMGWRWAWPPCRRC